MSIKLSQTALRVPLNTLNETPLSRKKLFDSYPATKSFLKRHGVADNYINLWETKINNVYKRTVHPDLRPYQEEGAKRIVSNTSFAIFDEQRLGKTPMMLASLAKMSDIENTILIIAPKSTLGNWLNECKKWFTDDAVLAIGSKQNRIDIYNKKPKVILSTYKTVYLDHDLLPKLDCMVIDEAHRLRNFKGQHSQASPKSIKEILKLSYTCKRKYALTGTPAANKSENIYPILHFLFPNLFTSYYQFLDYYYKQDYVYITRYTKVLEVQGFKPNKQLELQEFLNNNSVQRKRKDYMQWIPKVDKKEIHLNLTPKEYSWYNELVKTFECKELNISCPNVLSLLTNLRKLVTKSEEKREWVQSYLEDYPEDQVMIVSTFTSNLIELQKVIKNSKLLIGNTKTEERTNIEKEFNNKNFRVLLANIDVAKEGMKLEQCNTIIVLDSSLTYTDNLQLEDRLLPTTKEVAIQKDKQQIIKLLINDTVDMTISEQLKQKADYVDIINNLKKFLYPNNEFPIKEKQVSNLPLINN